MRGPLNGKSALFQLKLSVIDWKRDRLFSAFRTIFSGVHM